MKAEFIAEYADQLGIIKARIADLKAEETAIKNRLLAAGVREGEGTLYRFTLAHAVAKRVNWAAVAKALKPSRQLVTAHTSTSETDTLRVVARSEEAKKAA